MNSNIARNILMIIAMSLTLSSAAFAESACRKAESQMTDDEFSTCLKTNWNRNEVNKRYGEWKDAGCLKTGWGAFYDIVKAANPSGVSVDCDALRRRFPMVEAEYNRRNGLSTGSTASDQTATKATRSTATDVGSPAQGRGTGSAGNTN